jgi:dienelactone hydrolase
MCSSSYSSRLATTTNRRRPKRTVVSARRGTGTSLGVVPAQKLAQTRSGARGALFFYSCVPLSEFGTWPADVPVQIHGMDADPFFVGEGDIEAARALVKEAEDRELFLYPGDQHYFADSLPSYDESAARPLTHRVLAFLEPIG